MIKIERILESLLCVKEILFFVECYRKMSLNSIDPWKILKIRLTAIELV